MPRSIWVRNEELHRILIETARAKDWVKLESYLKQIDADEKTRGAALLRALNTPLKPGGMPLPAVLICHGAPLSLIQKVFELGGSPAGRFSLRDSSGRTTEQYSLMHLAVLSSRPDLVYSLPNIRSGIPLENSRGESPIRTVARIGSTQTLRREDAQRAVAIATTRYLASGGSDPEVARTVSMLLSRRAWGMVEAVLESWAASSTTKTLPQVKGSDICKWAWFCVEHDAPLTVFDSLRDLATSAQLINPIDAPREIYPDLLAKHVPIDIIVHPSGSHDWSELVSRLEKLEASKGLMPSRIIKSFINFKMDSIIFRINDPELEALGLIDPLVQVRLMTVFQCMAYGGAPTDAVKLSLRLGADTAYSALIGISENLPVDGMGPSLPEQVLIDGPALHLAIAGGNAELAQTIIESSASPFLQNAAGQTAMQHLFATRPFGLSIDELPLLEVLLRATRMASPESSWTAWGTFDGTVAGYDVIQLLALAERLGGTRKEPPPPPSLAQIQKKQFTVLDEKGALIEIGHQQLASLIEREFARLFPHQNIHKDDRETILRHSVDSLYRDDTARTIAERIAWALMHPLGGMPQTEERRKAQPDFSDTIDVAPLFSEEDYQPRDELEDADAVSSAGEFLSFPELGDAEHGFTYDDSQSDSVGDVESLDFDADISEYPEPKSPETEEISGASSSDTSDELSLQALPSEDVEPAEEGSSYSEYDLTLLGGFGVLYNQVYNSLSSAIRLSAREGELYEAYLLLKTLDEITPHSPSKLSAFSRSLRSLLYRFPPSVASELVKRVDERYHDEEGNHPYMAEFLCMLRHPRDSKRDPSSLGGLTLGITGVARLVKFGVLPGELVDAWGQIGTWNFSFPVWRYDSQTILSSSKDHESPSLMELAGMSKLSNPVDEFWINPQTGAMEHLLGSLFAVHEGTPFHDQFDHERALSLGFARLERQSVLIFRRACIIVSHPGHGTLIIRNSSHNFGRDRFKYPALWREGSLSKEELLTLSKKRIETEFRSIVGNSFFKKIGAMHGAARPLRFLMRQATTVRAAHARMKFDTNLSTAWDEKGYLLGGYRSPLFKHVVDLIEDRVAMHSVDGKTVVPDLAFANPDFFPAPHARLSPTPAALEVLRLLAYGEEHRIGEQQLRSSGVRDFLDTGFKHGRNSELILLPPET